MDTLSDLKDTVDPTDPKPKRTYRKRDELRYQSGEVEVREVAIHEGRRKKQVAQEEKRKETTESVMFRLPVGKRDKMQEYVSTLDNPDYFYKGKPAVNRWLIDVVDREIDSDVFPLQLAPGMRDKIQEHTGSSDESVINSWIIDLINKAIEIDTGR